MLSGMRVPASFTPCRLFGGEKSGEFTQYHLHSVNVRLFGHKPRFGSFNKLFVLITQTGAKGLGGNIGH